MDGQGELERRLISEAPGLEVKQDQNGRTVIRGYAAVFRSESQDLGGFIEIIEPTAFDDVMKTNPDVFGRFNHDRLLGRTTSGTMRLMVDERGLRYEIDPPRAAADVVELIERGDVRGSSFAFRLKGGQGEKWERDASGRTIRRITKFSSIHDAGPVETPAYLATETYVSKRAIEYARAGGEQPAVPEAKEAQIGRREADAVVETADVVAPAGEARSIEEGDLVSWDGGQGRVEYIMRDGVLGVPGSQFSIEASADNPAVLVRVYADGEETENLVGKRLSELTEIDDEMRAVSLKPTAGMAAAAKRGLRLHEEGKSGDGLKPETVARANKLARREEMNEAWVREMNAWFARHAVDQKPGWDTPGKETPGFVAHLLWGGNAARNFAKRKVAALDREEGRDLGEQPDSADPAVSMEDYSSDSSEVHTDLSPNNQALLEATESIAEEIGLWPQEGPNGAHYMPESPFADAGMRCANCLLFEGGGRCEAVEGDISPDGVCKLWVIPASKLTMPQDRSEKKPDEQRCVDYIGQIAALKAASLSTQLHRASQTR